MRSQASPAHLFKERQVHEMVWVPFCKEDHLDYTGVQPVLLHGVGEVSPTPRNILFPDVIFKVTSCIDEDLCPNSKYITVKPLPDTAKLLVSTFCRSATSNVLIMMLPAFITFRDVTDIPFHQPMISPDCI